MKKETAYFKDKTLPVIAIGVLILPLIAAAAEGGLELKQLAAPSREQLAQVHKNVARWHMGTTLTRVSDGTQIQPQTAMTFPEGALLSDDETNTLELPVGRSEYIMELAEFHMLSRIFLRSYGAAGRISIAASDVPLAAESPDWEPLVSGLAFSLLAPVAVEFPAIEAKFVKVTFDVEVPGRVGSFSMTGRTSVADTHFGVEQYDVDQVKELKEEDTVDFDFASLHAGSSVTHVSGGDPETAQQMIDDDTETVYTFPGDQQEAAVMVSLGQSSILDDVSVLLETGGAGTLSVYLFQALPEGLSAGEGGTVLLDAEFFANNPPGHVLEFDGSTDRASVQLTNAEARYVLLQWQGQELGQPLTISEISVMGPIPKEWRPVAYSQDFQFAPLSGNGGVPDAPALPQPPPQIPPTSQ